MEKIGNVLFWGALAFMLFTMIFSLSAAIYRDGETNAFIEACEIMGGKPIVGTHGTQACFKADTLL